MNKTEDLKFEPSALAGITGAIKVTKDIGYKKRMGFTEEIMQNATHLVWATGGGMVPETEMQLYLNKSKR